MPSSASGEALPVSVTRAACSAESHSSRSTIHGGFTRGYDVTLVSDAHTTEDLTEWGAPPPDKVISHLNLYWSWQDAPGRTAGTTTTAEVTFGPE